MADFPTKMSQLDFPQVLRASYNGELNGINTSGFAMQRAGNKVVITPSTTTDQVDYYYLAELLMSVLVTYQDATKVQIIQVERLI